MQKSGESRADKFARVTWAPEQMVEKKIIFITIAHIENRARAAIKHL